MTKDDSLTGSATDRREARDPVPPDSEARDDEEIVPLTPAEWSDAMLQTVEDPGREW
jgi:hypothetical protein